VIDNLKQKKVKRDKILRKKTEIDLRIICWLLCPLPQVKINFEDILSNQFPYFEILRINSHAVVE
jgi:hypothetical protein